MTAYQGLPPVGKPVLIYVGRLESGREFTEMQPSHWKVAKLVLDDGEYWFDWGDVEFCFAAEVYGWTDLPDINKGGLTQIRVREGED